MRISKIIILALLVLLVVHSGCVGQDTQKQKEYNKCASVCASVLEDDFVTMELCRRECSKEFLGE